MTMNSAQHRVDTTLSNGLRFLGERIERSRGVALAIRMPAGVKFDPAEKTGLAHLVADTLFKGTRKKDARALSDAFDFYGIRHSEHAGMESTTIQLRFLPEHTGPVLDLVKEVVSEASFPVKACDVARTQSLQELKHLDDEPLSKVFVILKELYFGKLWGHSELGTPESLEAISRDDFVNFWQRHYVPEGTLVAAAGKFDPDDLIPRIQKIFSNGAGSRIMPTDPPTIPDKRVLKHVQKDSQQTQIAMAFNCVPRNHPEHYAAEAAVGVLSGGMSGRLFTEVREKRALVYSVGAQVVSLRDTGAVYAYAGTTTPRAAETLTVMKRELQRLGEDVTHEEVERAKVGFKAHLLMDQESTGARARELLDDAYYEGRIVPVEEVVAKIDAVNVADVKKYWQSHPIEPYALVTLGQNEIESDTQTY